MRHPPPLPATELLLVSGGDARIRPDPRTGRSLYGCPPRPDPELVALGSCTATPVSEAGFSVADCLRKSCAERLRSVPSFRVHAEQAARLRDDIQQICGLRPEEGSEVILTASGTDAHLLAAHWLKPRRVVTVSATETGSGVPSALRGQHYGLQAAYGSRVAVGEFLDGWESELVELAPRREDGLLRETTAIDAECAERVAETVAKGGRVLLVVADLSKTGLIVPSVAMARALKARWPNRVEVLVDACQFRLTMETLRNYLREGWLVALTGSKFMAGPTFCGALLVPESLAVRYRDTILSKSLTAYTCRGDWPENWPVARALPDSANFGLLLRWEAALVGMHDFASLPETAITKFLRAFGQSVREWLRTEKGFRELPALAPTRSGIGDNLRWDAEQTIFPFVPCHRNGIPLKLDEIQGLYRALQEPLRSGRRFQFGQPVPCGHHGGEVVGALRLCVSARMAVTACREENSAEVIGDALAGLDALGELLRST